MDSMFYSRCVSFDSLLLLVGTPAIHKAFARFKRCESSTAGSFSSRLDSATHRYDRSSPLCRSHTYVVCSLTAPVPYLQGFNSENSLTVMPDKMALGHALEYRLTLCNAWGHRSYLGLFGNVSGCALYDVTPVGFAGACEEGYVVRE